MFADGDVSQVTWLDVPGRVVGPVGDHELLVAATFNVVDERLHHVVDVALHARADVAGFIDLALVHHEREVHATAVFPPTEPRVLLHEDGAVGRRTRHGVRATYRCTCGDTRGERGSAIALERRRSHDLSGGIELGSEHGPRESEHGIGPTLRGHVGRVVVERERDFGFTGDEIVLEEHVAEHEVVLVGRVCHERHLSLLVRTTRNGLRAP